VITFSSHETSLGRGKIAIGAVFRNEEPYVLEWLAWHILAGFQDFLIADNCSNDGTRELLEALNEESLIRLIYQPILTKNSQTVAYSRLSQCAGEKIESILFIDADEFLVHDSMVDGAEYQCLSELLAKPDCAMVCINWRCFGSSGLESSDGRLVLERFNMYGSDRHINRHLKSASKHRLTSLIGPHIAHFGNTNAKIIVNPLGNEIIDFTHPEGSHMTGTKESPFTDSICTGPLRINHYIIKSRAEYAARKMARGSAMTGPDSIKTMEYFDHHDWNEHKMEISKDKIDKVKEIICSISKRINTRYLSRKLSGSVDECNHSFVTGWLCDESGSSEKLKVNIFVNGVYRGSARCEVMRSDIINFGLSIDRSFGFKFTFCQPLPKGSEVRIKANANTFEFENRGTYNV
jgi:hypothetical protein